MRVGNKKLYKKAHQSITIELFRAIAERKGEMYGKPNKQSGAYQMGVQVSHRVYPEVQKKSDLQSATSRHTGHHPNAVQVQGSRDHRRTHDARSRASTVKYTTQNVRVKFHGILEGKKCAVDL